MDGYMLMKLMEERGYTLLDLEKFKSSVEETPPSSKWDNQDSYIKSQGTSEKSSYSDRMFREYFRESEDSKLRRMFENMSESEKRTLWESVMGSYDGIRSKHFSHSDAKYKVAEMFHMENEHKHIGEKYSIEKADEVHKRYKHLLHECITVADVYVAINCHYHNFVQLYKAWFGDSIDTKIIESSIVFWFKDEEFPESDKLWKYFKLMA